MSLFHVVISYLGKSHAYILSNHMFVQTFGTCTQFLMTVFPSCFPEQTSGFGILEHALNWQYLKTWLQHYKHISPFLKDWTRVDRYLFVFQQQHTESMYP